MCYFWVTDSFICSISVWSVNLGLESVAILLRRVSVNETAIWALVLNPVVVPLFYLLSCFSSRPMKYRSNSLVRQRTLSVFTSGMYTMYTCHSNEVSPPFHDPVSSQCCCERSTQSHDEWSRGHRFGRFILINWFYQIFTQRATFRSYIFIYPSCEFYMSWFVASDQFRQLSLLWSRHKVKANLHCADEAQNKAEAGACSYLAPYKNRLFTLIHGHIFVRKIAFDFVSVLLGWHYFGFQLGIP